MQVIRTAGYEIKEQKTEDGRRRTEGISNPSTVLRTGIEQGISNDEGWVETEDRGRF
jgi:hypothetical protein